MILYQRVTIALVLCLVVAAYLTISLNPSLLKMVYTVDLRKRTSSFLAGNNSFGNPDHSTVRTYTLSMLRHTHRNEQEYNWDSVSKVRTINSLLKTKISHATNNQQTANKHQTANSFHTARNTTPVTTSTASTRAEKVRDPFVAVHITDYNYTLRNAKKPSNKSYAIDLRVRANSTKTEVHGRHPNEVHLLPEDLMKQGPFRFLNNYKNPCWISTKKYMVDDPIHCLSYFYLIGAPKSGTTDMHRRLIQHPDISNHVGKEPHWLTRKHYYSHGKLSGHSSFTSYLKFFTLAGREIYMNEDANGYHCKIFGDCSASTMWDNDYWTILPEYRNLYEPLYTNADYIYHLNPNTKIIAMLRNPVERLYSDYLYFQHGSPKLFHEGVVSIIKYTHECLKNNTHKRQNCCADNAAKKGRNSGNGKTYTSVESDISAIFYQTFVLKSVKKGVTIRQIKKRLKEMPLHPTQLRFKIRLRIGVYHLHLKEYLRVFPRDQVMVFKLEDFSNETVLYMQKIFSFLEISKLDQGDLQKIGNPARHANKRKTRDRKAGEMFQETRKKLEKFYRPHNDFLTELLGGKFNYNNLS